MPGQLPEMQNKIVRMKICTEINAAFQIFHDLSLRTSRPCQTCRIAMMLICFHSPFFKFPADPPGLGIQIEIAWFFEMVAGNHDFRHAGLSHAVDIEADFLFRLFYKLRSIPYNTFHAV